MEGALLTIWLLRKLKQRLYISMGLLLIIAACVAWGLTDLIRSLEANILWYVGLLGLLSGWILARLPISAWLATLLAILLGPAGISYHLGGLGNPLLALLGALLSLPSGLLRWKSSGPPDLTPLSMAAQELLTRLNQLSAHLGMWLNGLLQREMVYDKIVTTLVWSLLFWLATVWAAWTVYRKRRPLLGVLPLGVLLAGSLNYARGDALILAPVVGATLLLMALVRYDEQEQRWIKEKTDMAEDIRLDLTIISILLSLGLMSISAVAPSLSIKKAIQLGQTIYQIYQEDTRQVAESLGLQPKNRPSTGFPANYTSGLPRQHLLGAGSDLSERVVMIVKTGELPPVPSQDLLPRQPSRYYWRAVTFDLYTGAGWESSTTELLTYQAGESTVETLPPGSLSLRLVKQEVSMADLTVGMIYVTGELISASEKFQAAWRTPVGEVVDLYGATIEASKYQAESLLATPTRPQLQAASESYPEWITSRYLQIPNSLPVRVRELALDLTLTASTPFEKVQAIEDYLRTFTYTLDISSPPVGRDVADYFLFDLKKGYCDYYATAMVVLARAAGVPARLVSGYASGVYDTPNARYIVTQADSHSWVDVYFPGVGWVEFEPTAGRPALQRLIDAALTTEVPELKPAARSSLRDWVRGQSWLQWVWLATGFLLLLMLLWLFYYSWRLHRQTPSQAIIHIYQRLFRHASPLIRREAGDTPYEFASRLRISLLSLARKPSSKGILNPALADLQHIATLYARTVYSHHRPTYTERLEAMQGWQRLRLRLWMAKFEVKFIHILSKFKKN